jgi:hypothetical protein
MAITLTHTASGTTAVLPDALDWTDEFAWAAVQQTRTYTTTGALLIEEATRQSGRPITLQGQANATWCTRALVQQLHAWAQVPGTVLSLTLRGVARSVTFDHEKGALSGLPVLFYQDGDIAADDWYVPTMKFVEL